MISSIFFSFGNAFQHSTLDAHLEVELWINPDVFDSTDSIIEVIIGAVPENDNEIVIKSFVQITHRSSPQRSVRSVLFC